MVTVCLGPGDVGDPVAIGGNCDAPMKLAAEIEVKFFSLRDADREVDGLFVGLRVFPELAV